MTSWKRDAFKKYMALNWSISLLQTSSNMCNIGEVCMMVKSLKEGSLTVFLTCESERTVSLEA